MNNKELIWVNKDFAKIYKDLESDIKKADLVNELIRDKKADITNHIQGLDDDLLRFKAFALNYSTEFKKAYDMQVEKLEQIYDASSEPIGKINRTTARMKKEIEKISEIVNKLDSKLKNLNTYKLEKVLDLINTYSNMSEEDKKIFKVILDNN